MSYFMQQRANREAIDNYQKNSNSAAESIDNLIAERNQLAEERKDH